jgi:hypothetical protein
MKAHGAKYEYWKFAGRTDAVRCGELLVEKQIAQQTLHLSYVGLPAQGVLTELAHLRCRGHFLARASPRAIVRELHNGSRTTIRLPKISGEDRCGEMR